MKYNITIGSDPEVFIEKDGKVVSAIGMIPGTKEEPHPISNDGHFIQTDNIAFEYNIPPTDNEDDFVKHIFFVKDYLQIIAEENGCTLSTKASELVDPEELKDPQALVFGCEPDFNPYTRSINERPQAEESNLRSVGGHIHIGYPEPSVEKSELIIKAFDMFVALPAMFRDPDVRRRELYGKAGAFRFKEPWGVEARVLSNFWIHNEVDTRWVYQQTIKAVTAVLDGSFEKNLLERAENVRDIINSNDIEAATAFLEVLTKSELVTI